MILYSVKDKQVGFMEPKVFASDGAAVRALANEVKAGRSVIAQNPEDFSIYFIGEFDEGTGELIVNKPTLLCEATAFVSEKEDV